MILSKKVRLKVPKNIESKFFQFAGCSRFAYNWAINFSKEYYDKYNKTISVYDLCKEFTKLRNNPDFIWLKEIPSNLTAQAIRDFGEARKKFFKEKKGYPNYKKKRFNHLSFYQDCDKIKIKDNKVQLTGLGTFNFCQRNYIPDGYFILRKINGKIKREREQIGIKPLNPRIVYDGLYWYLSVSYEVTDNNIKLNKNLTIGIDLGLKTFATICYNDLNKDCYEISSIKSNKKKFKKIMKQKLRIDRKISKNKIEGRKASKNYIKLLQKRLKYTHRMTNIQKNLIYETINEMVKSKPSKIVIEDLNIQGMMKNHKLAKWIQYNQFYTFRRILEYICKLYGIELIIANRFYPSSKTCSFCGKIKDKLLLSERIFKCKCGFKEDRDINASINLSNYTVI